MKCLLQGTCFIWRTSLITSHTLSSGIRQCSNCHCFDLPSIRADTF